MDGVDLVALRLRAGLKQWQVAAALGRSSGWLSRLECGERPLPPELAERISETIDELPAQRANSENRKELN